MTITTPDHTTKRINGLGTAAFYKIVHPPLFPSKNLDRITPLNMTGRLKKMSYYRRLKGCVKAFLTKFLKKKKKMKICIKMFKFTVLHFTTHPTCSARITISFYEHFSGL